MGYREKEKIINLDEFDRLYWLIFTSQYLWYELFSSNLLRYIWYIVTYLYDKLKQLVHL